MEVWRKISGNPNYLVSNTGRIRRIGYDHDHSTRNKKGYLVTDLYSNGKRKTFRVYLM